MEEWYEAHMHEHQACKELILKLKKPTTFKDVKNHWNRYASLDKINIVIMTLIIIGLSGTLLYILYLLYAGVVK